MKALNAVIAALGVITFSQTALASCDPGEIVIKLSHVTNTDKHPKYLQPCTKTD